MSANAILSGSVGKNSEIDSLTLRIQDLARSIDSWNGWMLGGLLVTVIAAALVLVTTRVIVVRSKQLAEAQAQLDAAKDRQLSEDLKDKDVEIQGLKTAAESAAKDIGSAQADAARANAKAAEANKTAEDERVERVKLEAQVAPRRLSVAQEQAIATRCLPLRFTGVRVTSYALDAESAILAEQIVNTLRAAGVNVDDNTASVVSMGGFALGIHVTGTDAAAAAIIRQAISTETSLAVAPEGSPMPSAPTMGTGNITPEPVVVLIGVKPIK